MSGVAWTGGGGDVEGRCYLKLRGFFIHSKKT